jgi:hypothetical protein
MNQLDVKTSKLQFIPAALLGLFFIPAGLGLLISVIIGGVKVVPLTLGFLLPAMFGVILCMVLRGYRKSVRHFTDDDLTRNDGRQFA